MYEVAVGTIVIVSVPYGLPNGVRAVVNRTLQQNGCIVVTMVEGEYPGVTIGLMPGEYIIVMSGPDL